MNSTRLSDYLPTFSLPFNYSLPQYIQQIHLRAKLAFLSFQSMPLYPLKFNDISPLLVEPYIIHGFRSMHKPWAYYWDSLFHKHNETINVWSHLLGVLYIMYLIFYYNQRINFKEDSHTWPFVVSLMTGITMFICSAMAHLLHSKSESVHMTCFLIDFLGVGLQGFGSGFIQIYYSAPQWYYERIERHFMLVLLVLGLLACFCNCFAQYYFHRPYPPMKRVCQFLPCGLVWFYSIFPICIRIFSSRGSLEPVLAFHLIQIVLFLLGAFLFAFDVPQRFCPGVFDFFGQGHHLFHLCIYGVFILQMHATYWDYEAQKDIIYQRSKPELIFCAGSFLTLVIGNIFIVNFFRAKIHKKYH